MKKSKTKISFQARKKMNPEIVSTINLAKKNKEWIEVAGMLATPRTNQVEVNLDIINKSAKEGEILVVPGKVLSTGEINKKIHLVAFSFSEKAKEKLLKSGSKISSIIDEIHKNPQGKGIRILKNENN